MVDLIVPASGSQPSDLDLQRTAVGDVAAVDSGGAETGGVGSGDGHVVHRTDAFDLAGQRNWANGGIPNDRAVVDERCGRIIGRIDESVASEVLSEFEDGAVFRRKRSGKVAETERRQGAEHGFIGVVKRDTSPADVKHAVAEEAVQGGCVAEMELTLAHEDPGTETRGDGRDDRAAADQVVPVVEQQSVGCRECATGLDGGQGAGSCDAGRVQRHRVRAHLQIAGMGKTQRVQSISQGQVARGGDYAAADGNGSLRRILLPAHRTHEWVLPAGVCDDEVGLAKGVGQRTDLGTNYPLSVCWPMNALSASLSFGLNMTLP